MNTAEDLKQEFGTRFPKLEKVAAAYLNCSNKAVIYRKAAQGVLPFPIFKMAPGDKSPWLVDIKELAKHLDLCSKLALESEGSAYIPPETL